MRRFALVALTSCALTTSFDGYDTGPVSGATYAVTGSVDGLDAGQTLTLLLNDAHEMSFANGAFAFPAVLHDGDGYVVKTGTTPQLARCTITGGTGNIAKADAVGIAVHCVSIDTMLAELSISCGPLAPAFDPATLAYTTTGKTSAVLPPAATTVTATAHHAGAKIAIDGVAVDSGVASAPIVFKPGMTPIDIAVTAPDTTTTQHYAIVVAGSPNPSDYFKASNTIVGMNSNSGWINAHFGKSIAIDGNTLVVGATGESSKATGIDGDQKDTSLTNAGAVYVFTRTGGIWSQQAYIKASNTRAGSAFGGAVALSKDTLAVGAFGESSNAAGIDGNQNDTSAPGAGAVYVFVRTGGTWAQQAYVKASNPHAGDGFGIGVALSGDTLAIGASNEASAATGVGGDQSDTSAPGAGAAYVFTRTGTVWSQQAYVKASNTLGYTSFGWSIALSGNTLVVGSPFENSNATGIDGDGTDTSSVSAGAAYVFVRTGSAWSQQAYVKASNTVGFNDQAYLGANFGWSVAVDQDTLAVGANCERSNATGIDGDQSDTSLQCAGAAYVFTRAATTWSQQAYVKASNTSGGAWFGASITVLGDMLAVGASMEKDKGAAYYLTRSGSVWMQRAYLEASNMRPKALFGCALALTTDSLAIGSMNESSAATGVNGNQLDTSAINAGATYVY